MPQFLPANQATYIPVPSQGQPIQTKARQQQSAQPPAQQQADPFRQEQGPPLLILPHDSNDGDDHGPSRQSRPGNPVRNMHDTPAFGAAIHDDPDNVTPPLAFADYLDEHGFEHSAEVIRRHHLRPTEHENPQVQAIGDPSEWVPIGSLHGTLGTAYSNDLHPWAHVFTEQHDLDGRIRHSILIGLPIAGSKLRNADAAWLDTTDHQLVKNVVSEMGDWEGNTDHRAMEYRTFLAGLGTPEKLARTGSPVRSSREDHEAFHAAIAASPDDDTPKAAYSDYLEENGRPHLAEAYRKTMRQNQVPWLGEIRHDRRLGSFFGDHGDARFGISIYPGSDAHGPNGKRFATVSIRHLLGGGRDYPLGYETDDAGHIYNLLYELEPRSHYIPNDALELMQPSHGGNNVRLTGNRYGHYTLTHDNGQDRYFQTDYDFPSLARSFGWDGEEEDIDGAREFLDSVDGDSIEDPGYFGPERFAMAAPKGGLVYRGIMYKGGERLPKEAEPQQQPEKRSGGATVPDRSQPPQGRGAKTRLRSAIQRKSVPSV